jgi:hypothetical protein
VSAVETVIGSSGADVVVLQSVGPISVILGGGADTVQASTAIESFHFTAASDSLVTAQDVISGFKTGAGGDQLLFQTGALVDGAIALVTGAYSGGGHASAKFDVAQRTLYADLNGDGVAEVGIVLVGTTLFTAANIGVF